MSDSSDDHVPEFQLSRQQARAEYLSLSNVLTVFGILIGVCFIGLIGYSYLTLEQKLIQLEHQTMLAAQHAANKSTEHDDDKEGPLLKRVSEAVERRTDIKQIEANIEDVMGRSREMTQCERLMAMLISTVNLRETVRRGDPIAMELAALSSLGRDDAIVMDAVLVLHNNSKDAIPENAVLYGQMMELSQRMLAHPGTPVSLGDKSGKIIGSVVGKINEVVKIEKLPAEKEGAQDVNMQLSKMHLAFEKRDWNEVMKKVHEMSVAHQELFEPWSVHIEKKMHIDKAVSKIYEHVIDSYADLSKSQPEEAH